MEKKPNNEELKNRVIEPEMDQKERWDRVPG
jgi:hypothetical protein